MLIAGFKRLTVTFVTPATAALYSIRKLINVAGNVSDAWFAVDSMTFEEVSTIDNHSVANIVINFDDGDASVYTQAYSYMNSLGLKGTSWVIGGFVGQAGNITLAQAQEMYAGGWDMGNHTWGHSHLSSLSEADQETAILTNSLYLENNGMPRGARYLAYPFGEYNADSLIACANTGQRMARTTNDGYETSCFKIANRYILNGKPTPYGMTLETAKAEIDYIISNKVTGLVYFHKITDTPEILNWPIADFQALMDYVALKRMQGY